MNAMQRAMRAPIPGPAWGSYPQRDPRAPEEALWSRAARWLGDGLRGFGAQRQRQEFVRQVRAAEAQLQAFGSDAFAEMLRETRAQLGAHGFTLPLLVRAFALVGRSTRATLGLELFDTQIMAARVLLDNRLAEMATGEGKTHAAMLAAATAALAGVPVHVVTANPYLALRDATRLAALYRALGLRVAAIQNGDTDGVRRATYGCEIVYCTASDLIFDYLRDRTSGAAAPLLRGLCMAIVDEADGVLIDEARTPFILAHELHDEAAARRHRRALDLARGLRAGVHFSLDPARHAARLEPAGRAWCARHASGPHAAGAPAADALWKNSGFREELVERALSALHLYRRDVHYLVRDRPDRPSAGSEVAIIDPTTGRVAHGRRWSHGLHQLIELKEGCAPSPSQATSAQLTYQRFFPRYWRLAGMSGTLRESRRELRSIYRLELQRVPLRQPSRRVHASPRIYADSRTRWNAVVQAVAREHAAGRPVLVGTDSVADALALSARLHAHGLAHQRLDARQDADEAACVARAGEAGCITVATNMAGRGTDIVLGPEVAARGGLHVIACQHNASARIDRQLYGRAARAGDPGSVVGMLSLDEGLLSRRIPPALLWALRRLAPAARPLPFWVARLLLAWLQASEERSARVQRAAMLESDRRLVRSLGFGARVE